MLATVEHSDASDDSALPPRRPGGGPWTYAMAHDGDMVTFADTAGELAGALIDGYAELDDSDAGHDEAMGARYDHLLMLAAYYQAVANADAMDAGLLDGADEDILTALYQDRTAVCAGGPWAGPRLILMATDYAPFTAAPAPTGPQVVLLDPSRETAYLRGLDRLGFIVFGTRGA